MKNRLKGLKKEDLTSEVNGRCKRADGKWIRKYHNKTSPKWT
jgi:hypothetical protein